MILTASMLKAIAKKCKPVVPSKPIKPILGGVHIHTLGSDKIIAEATDMNDSMRITFETPSTEPCDFVVQFSDIQALARLNVDVNFELDGDALRVRHKNGNYVLFSAPPTDYPELPQFEDGMELTTGFDIQPVLSEVFFSASRDEYMRNLCGVYFERNGDILSVVTADGYRLTKLDVPLPETNKFEGVVLLGATFIDTIMKLKSQKVIIGKTSAAAGEQFGDGNASMISRLSNLNFPDYKRVLPQAQPNLQISVNPAEFIAAIESVQVVKPDGGVVLNITDESITFEAKGENGQATSTCPVTESKGKTPFRIAFSPLFLREATQRFMALKDAPATMPLALEDEKSPLSIQLHDWQHIIMPIRTA